MSTRPLAANDFETINARMLELRKEREQAQFQEQLPIEEDLNWLVKGIIVSVYRKDNGDVIAKNFTCASDTAQTIKREVLAGRWRVEKIS